MSPNTSPSVPPVDTGFTPANAPTTPPPVASSAPVVAVDAAKAVAPVAVQAAPQVQQQKPTKQPLVTEALIFLDNLANKWLEFSGKVNHNPHLRISELIAPVKAALDAHTGATVDAATTVAIAALPQTPPLIDTNYVVPATAKKVSAPQPT